MHSRKAWHSDMAFMTKNNLALRGRLLWFDGDPREMGAAAIRYHDDGLIHIVDGIIRAVGDFDDLNQNLPPDCRVIDHRPHLVMPGFIDTHLHFPQTQVIASYGAQLLDWLNTYTFVEEQKCADPAHAHKLAAFFLDTLLVNGTTTAAVYCTVHPQSAQAFFDESAARGTRMIAGKVMMDRNAPQALRDTAQTGYDESKSLIEAWHGKGRQLYAVTPRFAITSTPEQLAAAGALLAAHPDCYMQTHLSENRREIETVAELYPKAMDYTGVYEQFGLLGGKSLFGHCIHLSERERQALHASASVAVFCPTSNLFLGSGLFDLASLERNDRPIRTAVASDIGGGTSYSMLRTMAEAYKVLQLQGQSLDPLRAFYMLTLGNAKALSLDHLIGSLEKGHEADLIVLDAGATPAMAHRLETVQTLEEELFLLMTMGDERNIRATYVMGQCAAAARASRS